jgi:tRNA/tmRNA/rRNA uracil-C5-methylase (TrmA/RlmC/RlmD family)
MLSSSRMLMALEPETDVTLTIEKPVVGGRMLARHEGQVVFVAGTIPGERVRARIERVSKQLAYAETIEVLTASPDRRASDVDWACGGSLYAHISYARQLTLKAELVADSFTRIGKMMLPPAVPVMPSQEQGYRMRARLHVRNGRFGFFREGTHDLCEAAPTRQLLPTTVRALEQLAASLDVKAIAGVASCEISENMSASERAMLLEMEPLHSAPLEMDHVDGITGLLFADHQSTRLTVGYGSPYVTDQFTLSGVSVALTHHVQSFFQGNRYLLPRLVERTLAQIPGGAVVDLYAGVGLFAVSLAAMGRSGIVAIEGDRSSARDLEHNAAPFAGAIHVEHMSVENFLRQRNSERPATIVLDPPRTGISREAMSGILALQSPHVVYVSCDLATVARDVKRFAEAGYRLNHIEAFDLFPNTAHVETLVVLTKSG